MAPLITAFTGKETWAVKVDDAGNLVLPVAEWYECELMFE
jgi:hypothetical protein